MIIHQFEFVYLSADSKYYHFMGLPQKNVTLPN